MRDPWVLRCPKGHSAVEIYSESFRCTACGATYNGEPFDVRETSFPVDGVSPCTPSKSEVLEWLVETTDQPTRSWVRAREADAWRSRSTGRILAELRVDGLVEKRGNGNRGHEWRPTILGKQKADHQAEARQVDTRAQTPPGLYVLLTVLVAMLAFAAWLGVMYP